MSSDRWYPTLAEEQELAELTKQFKIKDSIILSIERATPENHTRTTSLVSKTKLTIQTKVKSV